MQKIECLVDNDAEDLLTAEQAGSANGAFRYGIRSA